MGSADAGVDGPGGARLNCHAITVMQGVVFVVCVLTFCRGIIGELGRLLKKVL